MASPSSPDTIIVGGGLAGACAAFYLSAYEQVLLLEAEAPAAGASGAAAGLINPLMGRKAKAVWRLHDALDAVHNLIDEAGAGDLLREGGVLRPTVEPKQEAFFKDAMSEHPGVAEWLTDDQVHERFPDVTTYSGAMLIPRGGAIDVGAFVRRLLDAAEQRGAAVQMGSRVAGWGESGGMTYVELDDDRNTIRLEGRRVLLALGQGYPGHADLEALGLTGVKGQTVRVRRPEGLGPLLPMSGRGYIVPDGDTLIAGSSYEHDFDTLAPSNETTAFILEKTARMLPAIADAEVLDVKAGVRVKTEHSNLPLLGPLPGCTHIWTFTALGSKGLLTAPLLARDLFGYLTGEQSIPDDARVPGQRA